MTPTPRARPAHLSSQDAVGAQKWQPPQVEAYSPQSFSGCMFVVSQIGSHELTLLVGDLFLVVVSVVVSGLVLVVVSVVVSGLALVLVSVVVGCLLWQKSHPPQS